MLYSLLNKMFNYHRIINILPQNKRALFHHALMSQNGARGSVCISSFTSSVDADLQSFFNEYFVDTDSDDDDVEFEGSTRVRRYSWAASLFD